MAAAVTRSDRLVLGALFGAVTLVFVLGGFATVESVRTWYPTLVKPSFNPPDWLFGPVWTVLYWMMAVAAWRVWRKAGWPAARPALVAWSLQLALNLGWSLLFFGARAIGAAFFELVLLLLAVAWTRVLFARIDALAGWLFVPYLAWVTFAGVLNLAIWRLN
jgi:benzodiazapine receptor